jgi:hypothetical protein
MLKFESYTVRQTGFDQNIIINISNNTELGGLSDGLNSFIEEETGLSINPADDGDTITYVPTVALIYNFEFYNTGTTSYGLTLANAGFTIEDLSSDYLYKSYYIFQVYDSINSESQNLLHTGFFGGYLFPSGFSTSYLLTSDREANNFYLKNIDLKEYTGNTVYVKLSFFNAKKGKQQIFYNSSKAGDTTENIFYFNATLNRTNKTYSYGFFNTLNGKEFINYTYINKINENVNVIPQEKPVYPTGNTLINNQYFALE